MPPIIKERKERVPFEREPSIELTAEVINRLQAEADERAKNPKPKKHDIQVFNKANPPQAEPSEKGQETGVGFQTGIRLQSTQFQETFL